MHKFRYLLLLAISFPAIVQAQVNPLDSLEDVGDKAYGVRKPAELKMIIAALIQIVLGFVGIIFLILIIIGGMQWMMSGGNEKKIEDAKGRITNATIGLVIVVIAYSIAYSITKWLGQASSSSGTP